MPLEFEHFLHSRRLPHIWCPGCGAGIVTGAFLRVLVDLGLSREKTVVVAGIGCSSRAVTYLDLNSVHTLHGRALAFATGIKAARPDLTVVVFTGDGDGAAIGGNHLIHASRRNIDITCILFNNQIYGMTGGQLSPTMGVGDKAVTAPFGQVEPPFDLCRLVEGAGATFVARGVVARIRQLEKLIKRGIEHKGFAFIEAMASCPTEYGRRNPPGRAVAMSRAVAMLERQREMSITKAKADQLSPEELAGKIVTGVFHEDVQRPEFRHAYEEMATRVRAEEAARLHAGERG